MPAKPSEVEDRARDLYAGFLVDHPGATAAAIQTFIDSHPAESDILRRLIGQHRSAAGIFAAALPGETLTESVSEMVESPQPKPSAYSIMEGAVIDDFELVRLLGRGGMGEVWEAHQNSLNRRVALKLILPERIDERSAALFEREARAGARLTHPGLVAVYGTGGDGGLVWIAMELVQDGFDLRQSLEAMVASGDFPEDYHEEVAKIVIKIADALQAAHDSGVIHRDIKPQNILITPDNNPKVTDFGLARIMDEAALSHTGEFGGTYYYMSPEQAAAKRAGIDHRSDIFSLGAVMYELLALRRPFEGDTSQQVTYKVLFEEPADLTSLRSRIPEELAVICAKALEKGRERRFQTMEAFAADLRRFLAHEPILAKSPNSIQRVRKWIRRNPVKAAAGSIAAGAFVLIGTLLADNIHKRRDLTEALAGKEMALGEAEDSRLNALAAADKATEEARTSEEVVQFLVSVFEISDPTRSSGGVLTVREVLKEGATLIDTRLANDPLIRARLKDVLGEITDSLGLYGQSAALLEQSLATRAEHLGEGSVEAASSRNGLAIVYRHQGRYAEAEALLLKNIDVAESTEGPNSLLAWTDRGNLALVYWRQGRYGAAESLLLECLEAYREKLGDDAERTLNAWNHLGAVYSAQRQYTKAEECHRKVLAGRLARLGANHLDTVNATYNLALALRYQDRSEEAGVLFDQVLKQKRSRLGDTHPSTLNALNGVAVNRLDQDRVDDAVALFAEVYAGRKVALGDDHPDTLGALQNLALAFNRQEEYGKSQTAYREAYEGQCKSLGPDHPDCFRTAMSLGALSAQMGEFGEAEELLLDVVERATRVLGHSDPVALSAIRKTADLYLAMGIPETAVQLCCDWLDLLAEEPASELPDLREVLKLLNVFAWDTVDPARVHGDGDLALALEAARRATTLAPLNAAYHDTLAWAFLANERYEQAARASEKALELAPESEKAEYMGYLGDLRARTKARTQAEPDKDGE